MRALVWHGPSKVSVDEVPDPSIQESTDAVIRVTATGLCGSDLHLYDHGATMAVKPGDILGHEPMGVVEEVGSAVSHIRPGDTVVVPFNISCGSCYLCTHGMYSQCETTQNLNGRKGASLFGYTHMYGGVPGGQAQFLRVPQAHFGPIKIGRDGATEVQERAALLLSDVLPTSWQAVKYADIAPGGTVAIFGLGPIGQMSSRIAQHLGAGRVIGVDPNADRRETAARYGAEVVDPKQGDVDDQIRSMTGGRGADSVIEAVGMDATGSTLDKLLATAKVQPDRLVALRECLASCRRGGTVSVSGVYTAWFPRFPLGDLFDKQITLRWGQANVRRWTDDILEVLRAGDPIKAGELVTHEQPLEEAPHWYAAFRDKQPGVVKVVLRP